MLRIFFRAWSVKTCQSPNCRGNNERWLIFGRGCVEEPAVIAMCTSRPSATALIGLCEVPRAAPLESPVPALEEK